MLTTNSLNEMRKSAASTQSQHATVHDTLQRLTKQIAFNALWEPKDTVTINVNAVEKRRILGDKYLESVIKTRPRKYMTPSVSLDDVQDVDVRKLMIDFSYKTTANQAAGEVWSDFVVRRPCSPKKHVEEPAKSLFDRPIISRLPARFQGGIKWDNVQYRSFFDDDICFDSKDKIQIAKYMKKIQPEICVDEERLEKQRIIRKLISQEKLNTIYDKLPLSYTGHRPRMAFGVPLERREIY